MLEQQRWSGNSVPHSVQDPHFVGVAWHQVHHLCCQSGRGLSCCHVGQCFHCRGAGFTLGVEVGKVGVEGGTVGVFQGLVMGPGEGVSITLWSLL